MIDKSIEPYYDIMLNVFLAFVLIIIIHNFYDCPRTIVLEINEPFANIKKPCNLNTKF